MKKIDKIKVFTFSYGALFSAKVDVKYEDGKIYYKYNQLGTSQKRYDELVYEKNIEISHQKIIDFLIDCDAAYVREWEKQTYVDEDILDGMNWNIHIEIILDEDGIKTLYKAVASGYAMFPNTYMEVVALIEKLIHESMTSRFYNAQVMRDFVQDNIKGEENRRNLFRKISPIVLEIIEGVIAPYLLDYSIEDILYKYMNLLGIFGVSESDESIMKYYLWACEGKEDETGIAILDFMNPSMKRAFEDECRMLLAEADIWYLDKEAQKDIDTLFTQTRMILMYANQRDICCESYRRDDFSIKTLSFELAETVTNLKKYTDENMITHESYNPKAKAWLTASVAQYLEHVEEEAKKIKEIGCCIRQYDYTLLEDEAVHDVALILSNKIFDEILKFIDRLHVKFQGAEDIKTEFIIQDGDIADLVEMMSKNHDFSDILPLIEVFGECTIDDENQYRDNILDKMACEFYGLCEDEVTVVEGR